ncbi:MAG: hypothetical protein RLZZ200_762, partial [Pseudomonadota bacterium]
MRHRLVAWCGIALALFGMPPAVAQTPGKEDATWAATLERIAKSVVAIQVDGTRAFDTEWNTSSQATG